MVADHKRVGDQGGVNGVNRRLPGRPVMSGSTSSGPGPNCEIDKTAMLQIYMLGARKCVEVAMDWTDFDADNQATIMLSLITRHGRTTPDRKSVV